MIGMCVRKLSGMSSEVKSAPPGMLWTATKREGPGYNHSTAISYYPYLVKASLHG